MPLPARPQGVSATPRSKRASHVTPLSERALQAHKNRMCRQVGRQVEAEQERQNAASIQKDKRELMSLFESARDVGCVLDVDMERHKAAQKDKRELLLLFESARDDGSVLDVARQEEERHKTRTTEARLHTDIQGLVVLFESARGSGFVLDESATSSTSDMEDTEDCGEAHGHSCETAEPSMASAEPGRDVECGEAKSVAPAARASGCAYRAGHSLSDRIRMLSDVSRASKGRSAREEDSSNRISMWEGRNQDSHKKPPPPSPRAAEPGADSGSIYGCSVAKDDSSVWEGRASLVVGGAHIAREGRQSRGAREGRFSAVECADAPG
ncbi:hypothetical protein T484DRAFT_1857833 [Baffinella frigidus]|nr:hypothetical protein T484DRAFT_1857833 [Cryptophyta sp. CCMP2293]